MQNLIWLITVWHIVGTVLSQEITLSADGPVRLPLSIQENTRVTITALGSETIDTVLTLLDDAQRVAAYSDDRMVEGVLVRDAQIVWEEAGEYTLLVDSFNGVSEGLVRVEIVRQPLVPTLSVGSERVLALERWRPLRLRLRLDEPLTVQVSASSVGRRLDLIMWLRTSEGDVLLADDADGRFDTRALWTLRAGEHDLWIVDWLGRAGEVSVELKAMEPPS
jgi:hypothetical protein